MKIILAAVLACAAGLSLGCKSRDRDEKPQPMILCAGCHKECPTDRACPKAGKCAGCGSNCGKPAAR